MKTINLENIKTPQGIIDAFNILNEKAIEILEMYIERIVDQ